MRALALGILLVINLVLLFWQVVVHKPEVPVSAAQPDVGELLLLSEVKTAGVADAPDLPPHETATPVGETAMGEEIAVSDQEPAATPVELAQVKPEPEPAETVEVEETSQGQPKDEMEMLAEVASASSPEVSLAASSEAVQPADSDTPVSDTREQAMAQSPEDAIEQADAVTQAMETGEQPQVPAQEAEPVPPARACWRLGPFDTAAEAMDLAQELPPGVSRLSVEQTSVPVERGYYVLIPPLASRAEALRIERQLKAEGVEDSWVFVAGPLKNAVSLGLFNREINAQRRLRRVQSKGFEPELRVRYRDVEKTVLLVEGTQEEAVREALEALGGETLEMVDCPE